MRIIRCLFFVFLLTPFVVLAQTKDVLFTIDNHPHYTDEFVRVYNKNLDLVKDDSQKNLDNYLELYIGYKLKVEKAYKIGLQNSVNYQNELKSYRTQLSKNYLSDSKVTNELVQEAYDRMQLEIRASHILVLVDENASPEDTLKGYQKIADIKKRIESGADFASEAQQFSEDPSAKENNGDLGYFSAFRMVYPFENAVFSTAVGKVSKPFRTKFGYHIVKVVDKRANRGEVTIAHIMILKPASVSEKPIESPDDKSKATIDEIYKKIQQGESFESLAQQFSEDKSSASKGGVLQRFGSGQLSSEEFENAAFSLQNKNDISLPFQSQFGWHIVKLIEKHSIKTLVDMKSELEEKVRKDERSLLITNSLAKKLRNTYSFYKDQKAITAVKKVLTEEFYAQTWEQPLNSKDFEKTILVINENKKITAIQFLNFIHSQQKSKLKVKPLGKLVDVLFEKFIDEQIMNDYNDNLENVFPEFKYVMDEYRDGLLLFDLMDREIWTRAKSDTLGIQEFYNNNRINYQWKKRVEVDIFSSTNKSTIEKAMQLVKKGISNEAMKEKINKEGKVNIMVKSGIYEEDDAILSSFQKVTRGISDIVFKDNYYFILNVREIKEAGPKLFTECKGKVMSDYQQFLESNWVSDLKKEFVVKVQPEVFYAIKKQLQQ
ncbi:peptidylprolyl isomerase [Flavobacterium sp.]|jgi:peptidyl-prolyl cis-trans isomerase SurA|uniref:peptidylprolyl isomerase n=1 Tax=Flavobacterium sp. TaxID=239 RepID=UPI0037BF06FA